MSEKGFGYMWAGAKATYGTTRGRACYEVIIDSNNDVSHLENETCPNVLRCGWSVASASMQLGEEPLSWGFGGIGMKSVNCQFSRYGQKFGVGDVIGCYLVSLRRAKNYLNFLKIKSPLSSKEVSLP